MDFFGSPSDDLDVLQTEFAHHFRQERRTAQQGLNQCHVHVGPRNREDETRESGARTNVCQRGVWREQLGHQRTVENVPIPQTRDFTRPNQPADNAVRHQQCGVLLDQR